MTELKRTLVEDVFYPPHDPREASAEYRRVHHRLVVEMDEPCWICGIRHSTGGQMETHHDQLEWAAANGVDLTLVTKDFPALTDSEKLRAWLDSEGNMLVLCLAGNAPVMTRTGSCRLDQIRVGDEVIGGDGLPHRVSGVWRRFVDEHVAVIDGVAMTLDHPLLGPDGWLTAGEVVRQRSVTSAQVLAVAREELEILDPVVTPVAVSMVDALLRQEAPPKVSFHHEPVLHDRPLDVVLPHVAAHVSPRGELRAEEAVPALVGNPLQRSEPAFVGAVALAIARTRHDAATFGAGDLGRMDLSLTSAPDTRAADGTCRVPLGEFRDYQERGSAHDARLLDSTPFRRGWRAVRDARIERFRGLVHDLTVPEGSTFVAGGFVVHNCAAHHRGPRTGIHSITYPAWKLQRWQGKDWSFIAQKESQ